MTFTGGEHVRVKPYPENKNPQIGVVVGLTEDGLFTEVEYRRRLGENETRKITTSRLEEMCKEHVYRSGFSSSSECGRKAKEDHLCGMHLSHKKRRATERADREEQDRLARERRDAYALRRKDLEFKIQEKGWREFIAVQDPNAGTVTLRWDDLIDLVRNA